MLEIAVATCSGSMFADEVKFLLVAANELLQFHALGNNSVVRKPKSLKLSASTFMLIDIIKIRCSLFFAP
jgi:hypothetical protein